MELISKREYILRKKDIFNSSFSSEAGKKYLFAEWVKQPKIGYKKYREIRGIEHAKVWLSLFLHI